MAPLAVLARGTHTGWNAWLMLLWVVLFWAAVTGVLVAVTRRTTRRDGAMPRDGTARARRLLATRYAAGEIDAAEYHARLRELGKTDR